MNRLIALLFLLLPLHAAGPVRCAFDAKVVDWNYRCLGNSLFSQPNYTHSLIASSVWIGQMRFAGLYPGNIIRANLMCGRSYGGTNGCGDSITNYNIGSPQVPIINDTGDTLDGPINASLVNSFQSRWKYQETGSSAGLGCVSSNNPVMMDTGIVPSTTTLGLTNVHLAAYMMGGPADASAFIGINDNNVNYMALGINTAFAYATFWSSGSIAILADTDGAGFFLGTRTSNAATGCSVFKNNTLLARSTAVGGAVTTTVRLCLYGYNDSFISPPYHLSSITSHLCAGYEIGLGITDSVATNAEYNAWQQFETLLTRQK